MNYDSNRDTRTAEDRQQDRPHSTELCVVQYNCGGANYRLARSVFDQLHPEQHHIIAVQQPYLNAWAQTTYCPAGYHLCYTPTAEMRVGSPVGKRTAAQEWRFHQGHADVPSLTRSTTHGPAGLVTNAEPY